MYRQLVLFIQQVIVCVLLTMRIYALYGRNVKILGYMLGSATILAIVAAWSLFGQKSTTATSGCHIGSDLTTSVHLATAWETYKSRHTMGMSLHIPLVSLMLRDGAVYFAVMALANLSNILTFYVPIFAREPINFRKLHAFFQLCLHSIVEMIPLSRRIPTVSNWIP
ncbi:hypothetical protein F5879DRAFT_629505 [Lentinula edodes]|nr:hypothetical protein F5879DRAFT_629505 [Lentinula edodes]